MFGWLGSELRQCRLVVIDRWIVRARREWQLREVEARKIAFPDFYILGVDRRNNRPLAEYGSVGVLVCWCVGVLVCWCVGVLVC